MNFPSKRLLFDWHIPDFGQEIRLDIPAYLSAVDRMKPDLIYLMAKSAAGCTYYNDAYGYHNASLKQDIFADLVEPLHQRGVRVAAYFNVTLNDVVAQQHPEWHQADSEGKPAIAFTYHQLCMNSPYRDLLYNMMVDIAAKYAVDGFWFDLTYIHPNGCFCEICRKLFAERTGIELKPGIGANPQQCARFHEFRRDTRRRFIEDAIKRISSVKSGLSFGWNHAGDPSFAEEELDAAAHYSSVEFHPPLFGRGGISARRLRTLGKPFELMLPESLGSWGDWTVMSRSTMRTMGAIAKAHGGTIIVGHVAYPSGDLAGQMGQGVVDTIADAFRYIDQREELCRGARSVPVAACLYSVETWRAAQGADGLNQRPHVHFGLRGGADLLAENNVHFDILSERQLEGLHDYELLILSEVEYVSAATAAKVRDYVSRGGTLVAMGQVSSRDQYGRPLPDFELADLLGVNLVEQSPYSVAYLDRLEVALAEGLPDMPLLLKAAPLHKLDAEQHSLRCRVRAGAKVWARFTEPALEPDLAAGRHIYHLHAPPANHTDWPAIVHQRFGKGRVVYIAGPLAYAFNYTMSPWLRQLFANVLGALDRPRRLRVDGPPGLEVSLMQQGSTWRLHLIPRTLESHGSVQSAEQLYVHGIRVALRKPELRSVRLEPKGRKLALQTNSGCTTFDLPPIREWTIVSLEGGGQEHAAKAKARRASNPQRRGRA